MTPPLSWPYIPARWFTHVPREQHRVVRVLVVHVMEAPEKPKTAEAVARWFQTLPETHQASAHVCVDWNTVIQSVWDNDVANAAPGCNHDGIQMELAGYSAQSADEWQDEYSMATLQEAARVAAYYVRKYALPIRRLSVAELLAGARGIVGHDTVTLAYHKSDHMDPGPHFPWAEWLGMVAHATESAA